MSEATFVNVAQPLQNSGIRSGRTRLKDVEFGEARRKRNERDGGVASAETRPPRSRGSALLIREPRLNKQKKRSTKLSSAWKTE